MNSYRKYKVSLGKKKKEIFPFVKHGQNLGTFMIRNILGTKGHILYNITYRNSSKTCPESDKGILMTCVWKMGKEQSMSQKVQTFNYKIN